MPLASAVCVHVCVCVSLSLSLCARARVCTCALGAFDAFALSRSALARAAGILSTLTEDAVAAWIRHLDEKGTLDEAAAHALKGPEKGPKKSPAQGQKGSRAAAAAALLRRWHASMLAASESAVGALVREKSPSSKPQGPKQPGAKPRAGAKKKAPAPAAAAPAAARVGLSKRESQDVRKCALLGLHPPPGPWNCWRAPHCAKAFKSTG